MERYWNDYEMMSKVSKKLNGMNVSSPESSSQPQKTGSKVAGSASLHHKIMHVYIVRMMFLALLPICEEV